MQSRHVQPRTAVALGDCAPVIRHAQGTGRLRVPELARLLDAALAQLYAAGWSVTWVHVHRSANREAHDLARRAARDTVDSRTTGGRPRGVSEGAPALTEAMSLDMVFAAGGADVVRDLPGTTACLGTFR